MRKMLSLLLALLMTVTVVPVEAFAAPALLYESCAHHVHDETCGGLENACAFECEVCISEIQNMIDGLPAMDEIGEHNRSEVAAAMEKIHARYVLISDAALNRLDKTRYADAAFVLATPPNFFGFAITKRYDVEEGASMPQPSFAFLDENGDAAAILCEDLVSSVSELSPVPNGAGLRGYLPAGSYTVEESVEGSWDLTLSVNGEAAEERSFTGKAGDFLSIVGKNAGLKITTYNISEENDGMDNSLYDLIANFENNYFVSGDTVTVIGTREIGIEQGVELAIPVGVTVNWQANLTVKESSDPRSYPVLSISGTGTLNVSGTIENKDGNTASHGIYLDDDCSTLLKVTGTVSANGGSAIYSDGSNDIQIDGGTITSNDNGIYSGKLSGGSNIYLRNGAKVETKGCAIQSRIGQISIENATVTSSTSSHVIGTNGNLWITDDARIVNTGSGQALFMGKSIFASASDLAPTLIISDYAPGDLHLVMKGGVSFEDASVDWTLHDFFARSSDTAIFETVSDDTRWISMLTGGKYFELITDVSHVLGSYEYKNDTHHTYSMACADTACINYYNENSGEQEHVFNANDECPTCGVQFYDLYVGGIHVNERNAADVLGDGKVVYNPTTNTLSLNGATITSELMAVRETALFQRQGIIWRGNEALTVDLTGTNVITGAGANTYCGIDSASDITLTGTGSLALTGDVQYGLYSGGTITVNGPSLKLADVENPYGADDFNLIKGHIKFDLSLSENSDDFAEFADDTGILVRKNANDPFGPYASGGYTYFEAVDANHLVKSTTYKDDAQHTHRTACTDSDCLCYIEVSVHENHTIDENGYCTDCATQFAATVAPLSGPTNWYKDFAKAVSAFDIAWKEGEATLTLYSDVNGSVALTGTGRIATIDLNDHSITAAASDEAAVVFPDLIFIEGSGSINGGKYGVKAYAPVILGGVKISISGTTADVWLGTEGELIFTTTSLGGTFKVDRESYPALGQSVLIASRYGSDSVTLTSAKAGYPIIKTAESTDYYDYYLAHPIKSYEVKLGSSATTLVDGVYTADYNGSAAQIAAVMADAGTSFDSIFQVIWADENGTELPDAPLYPGKYSFTVKGKTSYTHIPGFTGKLEIKALNFVEGTESWNDFVAEKTYDGEPLPTPTVVFPYGDKFNHTATELYWSDDNGTTWKEVSNSNPLPADAGTYRIKAVARENAGCNDAEAVRSFTIKQADLTDMTLSVDSGVYNGAEHNVGVTVKGVNGTVLTEGTDYEVSVAPARRTILPGVKNVGSYVITVTGKDNYKGSLTADYTITKAALTADSVSAAEIFYGQKLKESTISGKVYIKNSSTEVEGVWSWVDPEEMPGVPVALRNAIFTPNDPANHEIIRMQMAVTVKPTTPEITFDLDDTNAVPGGEIVITGYDVKNPYNASLNPETEGLLLTYYKIGDTGMLEELSDKITIPQDMAPGTKIYIVGQFVSNSSGYRSTEVQSPVTVKVCPHATLTPAVGIDEHWEVCGTCGAEVNRERHSPETDELFHDEDSHWQECECGAILNEEGHSAASDELYRGGDEHWNKCKCGVMVNRERHSPETDEWFHDEDSHWQKCECGAILNEHEHIPGPAATASKPQICTVCERVLKRYVEGRPEEGWYDEDGDFVVYPSRKPGSKPTDDKKNPSTGGEAPTGNRTTSSSAAACNARYPSCHAYLEPGAGALKKRRGARAGKSHEIRFCS